MLADSLPVLLQGPGPWGLLVWQWLALPLLVAASAAAALAASRVSRWALGRLAARTPTPIDDELLERAGGPLTLGWWFLLVFAGVHVMDLGPDAQRWVTAALRVALLVAAFWSLLRLIDVTAARLRQSHMARYGPAPTALLPLGTRLAKVAIWAAALVTLLSEAGYPVASLVAGLGIGGIAVALAGQKTVENLFGAFMLGADQLLREGDLVRVEGLVGTVERIGLRSTRLRTLDRTLVTIPNGKLVEMTIESFEPRDRIRLNFELGLAHATTTTQVRLILDAAEALLRTHPKIWPDGVVARLKRLGPSSLDLEFMAWFQTRDWAEFMGIRQQVLLELLEIVDHAGAAMAFPRPMQASPSQTAAP